MIRQDVLTDHLPSQFLQEDKRVCLSSQYDRIGRKSECLVHGISSALVQGIVCLSKELNTEGEKKSCHFSLIYVASEVQFVNEEV